METICGLFDAATWIGEVLSRSEEKQQELHQLNLSVTSVTQSVRTFSDSLPEEDRENVFNSNQVFPELARVLKSAQQVLQRHSSLPIQDGPKVESKGFRQMLTSGMKQGSRTLQEGLEALSGRVGRMGDVLRLPEDELALIRQAIEDINRLMPQLQLAITTNSLKGSCKRQAEGFAEPQAQRLRTLPAPGEEEPRRPLLNLKLVSESTYAQHVEMPMLSTTELRPASSSTTSLESESSDPNLTRLVLGRQELINKKVSFEVPHGSSHYKVDRFISRDQLALEVSDLMATQATIDMATLVMGEESQEAEQNLASIAALGNGGVHIRHDGETRWRFSGKNEKVKVTDTDQIAILLESPPASGKFAPRADLDAAEAVLVLGIELRRP